jgi:hypothetical protein
MFLTIFQILMSPRKSRCDIPICTTQGGCHLDVLMYIQGINATLRTTLAYFSSPIVHQPKDIPIEVSNAQFTLDLIYELK